MRSQVRVDRECLVESTAIDERVDVHDAGGGTTAGIATRRDGRFTEYSDSGRPARAAASLMIAR